MYKYISVTILQDFQDFQDLAIMISLCLNHERPESLKNNKNKNGLGQKIVSSINNLITLVLDVTELCRSSLYTVEVGFHCFQ